MDALTTTVTETGEAQISGLDALTARLNQLLHDELNLEIDDLDQDLIEEGLLDSLSLVEMLLLLEEQFGIEVSIVDIDFEEFRTVRKLVGFVASSTEQSAAA
jgi:D-alanine--poly(phosphoribitol) ligase subunit 2